MYTIAQWIMYTLFRSFLQISRNCHFLVTGLNRSTEQPSSLLQSNTHDTCSRNQHHKSTLAPVSGMRVMQICAQIRLVPETGTIRTLLYSKPENGVHVTQ